MLKYTFGQVNQTSVLIVRGSLQSSEEKSRMVLFLLVLLLVCVWSETAHFISRKFSLPLISRSWEWQSITIHRGLLSINYTWREDSLEPADSNSTAPKGTQSCPDHGASPASCQQHIKILDTAAKRPILQSASWSHSHRSTTPCPQTRF